MTSTRTPPHNRVDPRQRQAALYSGQETSEESSPRLPGVTLATMKWGYNNQPVRYDRGRLMVGDKVVRVRKGTETIEVAP